MKLFLSFCLRQLSLTLIFIFPLLAYGREASTSIKSFEENLYSVDSSLETEDDYPSPAPIPTYPVCERPKIQVAGTVHCPVQAKYLPNDSANTLTVSFKSLSLMPPVDTNSPLHEKKPLLLTCSIVRKCKAMTTGTPAAQLNYCTNPATTYISGCVALKGVTIMTNLSDEFHIIFSCPSDIVWNYYESLNGQLPPGSLAPATTLEMQQQFTAMCEQYAQKTGLYESYNESLVCDPNANISATIERPGMCCSGGK